MKSKKRKNKKFIAILLCMVLVLSSAISVFADEVGTNGQSESGELQAVAEPQMMHQEEATVEEEMPVEEEPTVEEKPIVEEEPVVEEKPVVEESVQTEEPTVEEESVQPEEPKKSEAIQLRQQVSDNSGKNVSVIADLPEGAFQAETSEISMEVSLVSTEEAAIVKLMKNAMSENTSLGNYVMYSVTFKLNGVPAEPEKAISIHLQGTDLNVGEVKKATVFYYNPAGSDEGNAEDELVVLTQRNDMLEALQKAGEEIPENFDEIYDLSEITLNSEGIAGDIQMDARKNRIYGCFVTEEKMSEEKKSEEKESEKKKVEKEEEKAADMIDIPETEAVYADTFSGYSAKTSGNVLSHEKYIKRNPDGTYNITLNASGTVGTEVNKKPVDIVLIVDTSGSMGNDNKLRNTKNAIKALISTFNKKADTVDAQYKLVTFSNGAEIQTRQWVTGNTLYNNYVRNLTADGGTNYDKGLSYGATAIGSSTRENAKKVVIFLTDGQPTFYGNGPSIYGNGPSNCGADTSKKTLDAALSSAASILADDFYAVGINLPGRIPVYKNDASMNHNKGQHGGSIVEWISGQEVLNRVKNNVTATTKDAWNLADSSELTEKFEAIAGSVSTIACSDVEITDKLSQYVDVTADSKLKVRVAVKSNGNYSDRYEQEFSLTAGGDIILDGQKIATVAYDQTNKTAKLTFVPSYELEEDYYYYLTITNVIPNQTAFDAYERSEYGGTSGDAFTDEGAGGYAGANTGTSSGQPGFRSNETATVSYEYKGRSATEYYAHPVVQVETIQVEKKWAGGEPGEKTTILVQLVDKNGQPVEGRTLELNADNQWKGKFVVEESDNYSVRELKEESDGTYSVINENGEIQINGSSYQVSYIRKDNGTWEITNTKQSQNVKIIKQSTSGVGLKGAEFTLTDSSGEKVTYTSEDGGSVLDGKLNHGTYTLEEIKAPGGYRKLVEKVTIKVTKEKVEVSGSSKVICRKNTDGVYEIIIKNEVLSDLPNAGGPGIFQYLCSGLLLMMIAIWLYRGNSGRMRLG